jgi:hypothetical protein
MQAHHATCRSPLKLNGDAFTMNEPLAPLLITELTLRVDFPSVGKSLSVDLEVATKSWS